MKIELLNIKKGDFVYKDCVSSMGASSTGLQEVKEIIYKYDEDTGAKYNVIVTKDGSKWDSRNGGPYSGSPMFYIEPVDQPEFSV